MKSKNSTPRYQGFSLLEVLVSIVILSLALLGLAGMMMSTLRSNHSAYHRSQATWLAYDIVDRMRANRSAALAQNYNIAVSAAPPSTDPEAPASIQAQDITEWRATLAQTLPGGTGSVVVTPATRSVTVVIQWDDSRGTGGSATQQFRIDSQL